MCVSHGQSQEWEGLGEPLLEFSRVKSKQKPFGVILEHGPQKPPTLETSGVGIMVGEKASLPSDRAGLESRRSDQNV